MLTVTDVSMTCAVVIFRVKVSCITSVDGIILWLWVKQSHYQSFSNSKAMLLSQIQLKIELLDDDSLL